MSALRDRISWFTQVPALRTPVVQIINAIEEYPGHFQVLSSGLTFLTLCRGGGVDPHEVLQMLIKMERDADAPFAKQFIAMKEYARNELNE